MQKTLLAVAAVAVCASLTEAAPDRKFLHKPARHHNATEPVHHLPHHNVTAPGFRRYRNAMKRQFVHHNSTKPFPPHHGHHNATKPAHHGHHNATKPAHHGHHNATKPAHHGHHNATKPRFTAYETEEYSGEQSFLTYKPSHRDDRFASMIFEAEEELAEALDASFEQVAYFNPIKRVTRDIMSLLKNKATHVSTFDEEADAFEADILAILEDLAPEDRITALGEVLEELGEEMEDGQQWVAVVINGVLTIIQIVTSIVTRH